MKNNIILASKSEIRKKIEKNPKLPKYLKTKRGSGYVLWID